MVITIDVLLMMPNIVVVHLHIGAFPGQANTNVTAFSENIIVDVNVPAFYLQSQQVVTWIVASINNPIRTCPISANSLAQ